MLTEAAVKQTKPAASVRKLFDERGLYLEIAPSGGKWWRLKYRHGGKERRLSLGVYPDVTLKMARERCEDARKLLTKGIDPSGQRKADKAAEKTAMGNTFAALADVWHAKKSKEWAPSTAAKARAYLNSDLIPALGNRPISEIKRRDLADLLVKIEQRGALDVAKKCRQWLSGVFRYALVAGTIEVNPATDLHIVAAPSRATRHYPRLPEAELPGLLTALDAYQGEPATVRAIRLLMLVACRPGELRHAAWNEINLDTATWAIPASKMKMKREHVIPLPVQAVELLREQQRFTGERELVFSNRDTPLLPISENTLGAALNRMGFKNRQTAHGFRHLISTALNERGFNSDWIERQLAHGDENEIRAVYNKAEYLDQRREMMQQWADYLDGLKRGKVIAGKFGKAA